MTKWVSNNVESMKSIQEEHRIERNVDIYLSMERNEMTLGRKWNVRTGKIFGVCEFGVTPTRRTILSFVAFIFDPDVFIGPVVLPAKLILQDTCRQNLAWDTELPTECFMIWDCWLGGVKLLSELLLSRCLVPEPYKPLATQMHCFANASKFAYGVVAYVRFDDVSHQVRCSFLLAKSKVAKPKTKAPSDNGPESTL